MVSVEESGFEAESTNDDIALQSHVISSAQCREGKLFYFHSSTSLVWH